MWTKLVEIVLGVVLKFLAEKANEPDTAVDGDRNPSLKSRLRDRVRRYKDSLGSSGGAGPVG